MDIFDYILKGAAADVRTRDLEGKLPAIAIAPVYQVLDDDRVIVLLPETGGRSPSPPLWRVLPGYNLTYPQVKVGDTVCYGFIEGNPNKGVYWGVLHNRVNPHHDLTNYTFQHGITSTVTTPDVLSQYTSETDDQTDLCGYVITKNGITLEKRGNPNVSLTLTSTGVVITVNNMVFTFSETGLNIAGTGATVAMTGIANATINGNQMATVGAVDDDGDALVTKGW